jgi:hypothetical protein
MDQSPRQTLRCTLQESDVEQQTSITVTPVTSAAAVASTTPENQVTTF